MSKFHKLAGAALICLISGSAHAGDYGLGREALPEEIAAWDIDVRPDGQGLPKGGATAHEGEVIFAEQCAACHGDFAEGIDRWPELAGGHGSLPTENPVKTVGSYWPYASTVYDYIRRAMPFGYAQSLTPDEIYAVTAYILNMNDVIDEDFVLSDETFTSIELPNQDNFVDDPRPDVPAPSIAELCMTDCKDEVTITMRARVLDVTPTDEENPSASID